MNSKTMRTKHAIYTEKNFADKVYNVHIVQLEKTMVSLDYLVDSNSKVVDDNDSKK